MRALSVRQPWAELIAQGKKKIEYRSWQRSFRGDLLIVSSVSRHDEDCVHERLDPDGVAYGATVCIVDLWTVTGTEGDYRWHLRSPRRVELVKVRGFASIYNVNDKLIRPSEAQPAARSKPKPRAARQRKLTDVPSVLVVASEDALGRSWKLSLKPLGCTVLTERDGFGAWKRLESESGIGCVVLDNKIQGRNALDVIDRTRTSKIHA